jgi:hypothetical protein
LQTVFFLKPRIPLIPYPGYIVVIVVSDAQADPPVLPRRPANIQKIAVLPAERQVETVKIIAREEALGKIPFQMFFPAVPAVNIPYGKAHH